MQVIQTTGLHEEPGSTGSAEIERLLTKINTRVGFDALKIVRADLWGGGTPNAHRSQGQGDVCYCINLPQLPWGR